MKRRKKKFSLALLLIVLLGLTVGYSLLSTTLKINGTAGVKSNSWDVYWDSESINVTAGSVTAENPVVDQEKTTASYEVTLELPGDFYEFTIDAVNNGSVDAMVDSLVTVITDVDDEEATLPNYVKYSVTYADGVSVSKYDLLSKKNGSSPTRETYKVRIEYLANSTTLPDTDLTYKINTTITYNQADENAKERSLWLLPEGKTKDNLTVGDEICTKGECFNFLHYDGTNNEDIVMLSKYNLKVGNIYDSNWNKTGEYSQSDSGYGLQSSEARGYVDGASTFNGTVAFSTTSYWMDGNNLKSPYNENDTIYYNLNVPIFRYRSDDSLAAFPTVYDGQYKGAPGENDYSIVYYVDGYKTKLTEYGVTIKDTRLLTYAEATDSSIGCSWDSWTCPTTGFITNTTFWLGSAVNYSCVWYVRSDGNFTYLGDFDDDFGVGVRPVIVVSKTNM